MCSASKTEAILILAACSRREAVGAEVGAHACGGARSTSAAAPRPRAGATMPRAEKMNTPGRWKAYELLAMPRQAELGSGCQVVWLGLG